MEATPLLDLIDRKADERRRLWRLRRAARRLGGWIRVLRGHLPQGELGPARYQLRDWDSAAWRAEWATLAEAERAFSC